MADNDNRPLQIFGKRYPLVTPPEFTMGELVACENEFGAGFDSDTIDARKLASILFVSVRRVEPSFSAAAVLNLTADELREINEAVAAYQQEQEPNPTPTGAEAGFEHSHSVVDSNGAPDSPLGDSPSPTGSLSSAPSSDSAPLTSATSPPDN